MVYSKQSDVNCSPKQPFLTTFNHLELDISVECSEVQVTPYQNMSGILSWVVELGRIDVSYEIFVLSQCLVQLCTGHFVQALHILCIWVFTKTSIFI